MVSELGVAEWIRSPESKAMAWGPPEWTNRQGTWTGVWAGSCKAQSLDSELPLNLSLRERIRKPAEPTVLLRVPDVEVTWRIDHNGGHRDSATGVVGHRTHLQLTDHDDICHYLDRKKLCSPPTDTDSVSEDDLLKLLIASAQALNVSISGIDWAYHPEGDRR